MSTRCKLLNFETTLEMHSLYRCSLIEDTLLAMVKRGVANHFFVQDTGSGFLTVPLGARGEYIQSPKSVFHATALDLSTYLLLELVKGI